MAKDAAAEFRLEAEQAQDQAYLMAQAIALSKVSVAPPKAPVNVDVPAVLKDGAVVAGVVVGDTLTCTVGNWEGAPTEYKYQWKRNSTNVGDGSDTYVTVSADATRKIGCVVTAINAVGSTAAPMSNTVDVTAGG